MTKLSCLLILILSLVLSTAFAQVDAVAGSANNATSSAQNFNLFEAVDSTQSAVQRRSRASQGARATISQPEFTLLGTTRIGDRYTAILNHRDGSTIVIRARPDANTRISQYSQYAIVDIGAGKVSVRFPGESQCVAFPDKGVSCNSAGNIAQLSLANGAPLASRPVQVLETVTETGQEVGGTDAEPGAAANNPFAALRDRTASRGDANAAANTNRRFTPRRIAPEDVPDGMRVVSTPFGDRLVEQ